MPTDPQEIQEELFERDRALDRLERTRADLVEIARRTRDALFETGDGSVCSIEVIEEMKRDGLGPDLERFDLRWIGAVFRESEGLMRVGWRRLGSHGRPVSIWRRSR